PIGNVPANSTMAQDATRRGVTASVGRVATAIEGGGLGAEARLGDVLGVALGGSRSRAAARLDIVLEPLGTWGVVAQIVLVRGAVLGGAHEDHTEQSGRRPPERRDCFLDLGHAPVLGSDDEDGG